MAEALLGTTAASAALLGANAVRLAEGDELVLPANLGELRASPGLVQLVEKHMMAQVAGR